MACGCIELIPTVSMNANSYAGRWFPVWLLISFCRRHRNLVEFLFSYKELKKIRVVLQGFCTPSIPLNPLILKIHCQHWNTSREEQTKRTPPKNFLVVCVRRVLIHHPGRKAFEILEQTCMNRCEDIQYTWCTHDQMQRRVDLVICVANLLTCNRVAFAL